MKTTTKGWKRVEERDLNFLEAVYAMHYVTVEQLAALFPSTNHKIINPAGQFRQGAKGVANRISKITRQPARPGLLKRIDRPHLISAPGIYQGSQPGIYTLDKLGAEALATDRDYDVKELEAHLKAIDKYLKSESRSKRLYFEHRLDINDFRVALTVALRNHTAAGWSLDEQARPYWTEPQPKKEYNRIVEWPVEVRVQTKVLGKVPDAVFILKPQQQQDHTIAYLLEIDRGTERGKKINKVMDKFLCYYHYHQQKLHWQDFGTKHLRILFVTSSETRLKNIIEKTKQLLGNKGSGIFWLTTSEHINLDNPGEILKPIWIIGHKDHFDPTMPIRDQIKHNLLEFTPPKA